MTDTSFWLALASILAWPIGAIVLVSVGLLLSPASQRAEMLRAVAEVVRAARGLGERRSVATPSSEESRETGSEAV